MRDGAVNIERTIHLNRVKANLKHIRRGRMDILVDELGSFVSVVEIKSTNWDKVNARSLNNLLSSHRRQIWKYIEEYVDGNGIDVCPGIIYPVAPKKLDRKKLIESTLNEHGIQVAWYHDSKV